MNDVIQLLQSHRSIRRFLDKKIEQDLFEQIVLSGQSAATSSYIQATTIIEITDTDLRQQLVSLCGEQKYIESAARFVVVCADMQRNKTRINALSEQSHDFDWAEQLLTCTIDAGLFAQNMVVAAQSADLGICYIGGIRNNIAEVSTLLALPELVYPVFGLCFGYPDQHPDKKPRLPMQSVLMQNQYTSNKEIDQLIDQYDEIVRDYYIARTKGKVEQSWSEQMAKQAMSQTRPFMLEYLQKRGFIRR